MYEKNERRERERERKIYKVERFLVLKNGAKILKTGLKTSKTGAKLMKWLTFWRKRGNNSQDLTDQDRNASLEIRRIHAQNKALLAQIEQKKAETELKKAEIAQETQEQILFELKNEHFENEPEPEDKEDSALQALNRGVKELD